METIELETYSSSGKAVTMPGEPHKDHTAPVGAADTSAPPPDGAWGPGSAADAHLGRDVHEGWVSAALEALPRAIRLLPPVEQRLVVGRFYEERPVDELALELRLSTSRATALLGDALRTLRMKTGG